MAGQLVTCASCWSAGAPWSWEGPGQVVALRWPGGLTLQALRDATYISCSAVAESTAKPYACDACDSAFLTACTMQADAQAVNMQANAHPGAFNLGWVQLKWPKHGRLRLVRPGSNLGLVWAMAGLWL